MLEHVEWIRMWLLSAFMRFETFFAIPVVDLAFLVRSELEYSWKQRNDVPARPKVPRMLFGVRCSVVRSREAQ